MSVWEAAPADGVFPEDFYSTTNLDAFVRLKVTGYWSRWPEVDLAASWWTRPPVSLGPFL